MLAFQIERLHVKARIQAYVCYKDNFMTLTAPIEWTKRSRSNKTPARDVRLSFVAFFVSLASNDNTKSFLDSP